MYDVGLDVGVRVLIPPAWVREWTLVFNRAVFQAFFSVILLSFEDSDHSVSRHDGYHKMESRFALIEFPFTLR